MRRKSRGCRALPEIMTVVFCLAFLSFFISQKEGFHMDELLSFELANAEFNPWIVPTQPEGRLAKFVRSEVRGDSLLETLRNLEAVAEDVIQNRGKSKLLTYQADVYEEPVWITGQQFQDYITVGSRDAFHYLSVYFNVKDDNHPPLHFMLLHTVSSVFRGQAFAWMGCVINLSAAAVVLILLILLGRMFAEAVGMKRYARYIGLFCALVYGVSYGAVVTVLLIRMYALVTMWCMAFLYLVLKKWKNRTFDMHNRGLIAVTVLGFWTQYFFLFYCILLAVTAAALLLASKRFREFWAFLRSMAASAVIGLALFPFAVSDVLSSGRGVEALTNLSRGLRGYGERLAAFGKILLEKTLSPWFWLLLFVCVLMCLAKTFGWKRKRKAAVRGKAPYLWMLLLPMAGYFLLAARMSPYLVDRYLMPVFPLTALAGALLLTVVLAWLEQLICVPGNAEGAEDAEDAAAGEKARGWFWRLAAGGCVTAALLQAGCAMLRYDGEYLYPGYEAQEDIAASHEGEACICIYDGVGYYENLKEFVYYGKTLLLTGKELADRQDRESIENLERFVLLIKDGVDGADVLEAFAGKYGFKPQEQLLVSEDSVHGDAVYLMRRED